MKRCEGCGACLDRRCSNYELFSPADPARCYDCFKFEGERRWRDEQVRRIEAWAVYEGGRRRLAECLAEQLTKYFARDNEAPRCVQWCYLWEITGDRKTLKKIVERCAPEWHREKKWIGIPPTEEKDEQAHVNV